MRLALTMLVAQLQNLILQLVVECLQCLSMTFLVTAKNRLVLLRSTAQESMDFILDSWPTFPKKFSHGKLNVANPSMLERHAWATLFHTDPGHMFGLGGNVKR